MNDLLVYPFLKIVIMFNGRKAIAEVIIGLLLVFTMVLGRCLFLKICSHIFMIFSQIGVVILVTLKQEVERKSEWLCGVIFFRSLFKVE